MTNTNDLKRHPADWAKWISHALSIPGAISAAVLLFPESPATQIITYYVLVASILGLAARDKFRSGFMFCLNPANYFPTLAGGIRVLICLFFGTSFLEVDSGFIQKAVAGFYLCYFSLCTINWSKPLYHTPNIRLMRVAIDSAFATVLIFLWDPMEPFHWLAVYLPLVTVHRSYGRKIIFVVSGFLYSSLMAALSYHLHFVANKQLNSETFAILSVVHSFIFILIWLFAYDERVNRYGAVLRFAERLLWVRDKSEGKLTNEILAVMTRETDTELLVAIPDDFIHSKEIRYCWNSRNDSILAHGGRVAESFVLSVDAWLSESLETGRQSTVSIPESSRKFLKWLNSLKQNPYASDKGIWNRFGLVNPEDALNGFWEFKSGTSTKTITTLEKLIRELSVSIGNDPMNRLLIEEREADPIYSHFEVVTAVVIDLRGYKLIFVNNVPAKYKHFARIYYDDGIEKIRICKCVFS